MRTLGESCAVKLQQDKGSFDWMFFFFKGGIGRFCPLGRSIIGMSQSHESVISRLAPHC